MVVDSLKAESSEEDILILIHKCDKVVNFLIWIILYMYISEEKSVKREIFSLVHTQLTSSNLDIT